MRSALGIVIGLAARAEVTLFDEPYAGLDPVARQLFYDRLLADYAEHPRTVLLSTHLIDEAAGLLERVRGDRPRPRSCSMPPPTRCAAARPASAARPSRWRSSPPGARSGTGGGSARRSRQWWPGRWTTPTMPGPGRCACSLEPLTLQQVVVHAAGRSADSQTREKGRAHELEHAGQCGPLPPGRLDQLHRRCPGSSWRSTSRSTWPVPPPRQAGSRAGPRQRRRRARSTSLFFIAGMLSIFRSLPFAFALGVGRRSYYAGTALLAVGLAAVYGLALAVLQVIERATNGWGVRLHFFRVAYILRRAVVPHLADLVRGAGPDVRLRHVVRAGLPALEPARPARLRRRAGHRRARRRRDRQPTRTPGRPSATSSPPSARPG